MSPAQGRPYLAIPGPSVMPDAVLRAMHRAAPNIYDGEIITLTESLIPDLRRVARTQGKVAIYIGNGHAAWEAALANTVAPGETVLALATGRFGHGWGEMAAGIGAGVELLDFGKAAPVDMDRFEQALRADKGHKIKAVLATHVDTSTSIRNDIAAMRKAMDAVGHPALLMADCIASLACDCFEMDAWGVDVMVTGSQKGLMTPPGLGFVFFSDKAAAVRAQMPRVSCYWDWAPRANPDLFYQYFAGTAPTHHLYGLRAALDMIHDEGIERVLGTSRGSGPRDMGRVRGLGAGRRTAPQRRRARTSQPCCHLPQPTFTHGDQAAGLGRGANRRDPWHRAWHGRGRRRGLAWLFPDRPYGPRERAYGFGHAGGHTGGLGGTGHPHRAGRARRGRRRGG